VPVRRGGHEALHYRERNVDLTQLSPYTLNFERTAPINANPMPYCCIALQRSTEIGLFALTAAMMRTITDYLKLFLQESGPTPETQYENGDSRSRRGVQHWREVWRNYFAAPNQKPS
jgi:hypothetical protein